MKPILLKWTFRHAFEDIGGARRSVRPFTNAAMINIVKSDIG
jgi:hypothetical protein